MEEKDGFPRSVCTRPNHPDVTSCGICRTNRSGIRQTQQNHPTTPTLSVSATPFVPKTIPQKKQTDRRLCTSVSPAPFNLSWVQQHGFSRSISTTVSDSYSTRRGEMPSGMYDKDKTTKDGFSPLSVAAANDRLSVVQCLLEHGADKEKAMNDSHYLLYLACHNGQLRVVQYLLEIGLDIDKALNIGHSPLTIAAANGHHEVVQFLLQQGADVNKADNRGRLPLDIAANETIKQLIRDVKKRRKNRKPK